MLAPVVTLLLGQCYVHRKDMSHYHLPPVFISMYFPAPSLSTQLALCLTGQRVYLFSASQFLQNLTPGVVFWQ